MNKSKIVTRNCRRCGSQFTTNKLQKRYCSEVCLQQNTNNRKQVSKYFIFERDGFKCFYCGISKFDYDGLFTLDHIIPTIEGGTNSEYNLVSACFDCNRSKKGYLIEKNLLNDILARIKKKTDDLRIERSRQNMQRILKREKEYQESKIRTAALLKDIQENPGNYIIISSANKLAV